MRIPGRLRNPVLVLLLLYTFLVSIALIGTGFKLFGSGLAGWLFTQTSNPFIGLFVGVLVTALVQSSSFTTSFVVGLVSSGTLSVTGAVPIIMGANIGTTVTNTLVSMGHVTRNDEFERAFAGATVHDFFNFILVLLFLPLEISTHFLQRTATALSSALYGISTGGGTFHSPVKLAVKPVKEGLKELFTQTLHLAPSVAGVLILTISLILLFVSLTGLVRVLRTIMSDRVENVIDKWVSRNALLAVTLGMLVTFFVQSSSITTSFLVPLLAANMVQLQQVFYITMGANIGTTITSILAALTGNSAALAIALVHLLFNLAGTVLFLSVPFLRTLPPALARRLASVAVKSKRYALVYVIGVFFGLPLIMVLLFDLV